MADNTRLAEIAERHGKATPGEWVTLKEAEPGFFGISSRHSAGYRHDLSWAIGMKGHKADADFIAHSHQDVPFLLAMVRSLESALSEILDIIDQGDTQEAFRKALADARGALNAIR